MDLKKKRLAPRMENLGSLEMLAIETAKAIEDTKVAKTKTTNPKKTKLKKA